MANLDRGTVLEADLQISDLHTYQANRSKQSAGRLEWPIMMIPLEEITAGSPAQTRQEEFNPDRHPEDAELAASIREYGVIEPILVCRISKPGERPGYQLIAGDRRRRAAAAAGLDRIPAIIRQYGKEIDLLTLAENTGRRDLTPYERAMALAKIVETDGGELSYRQLAEKTGISLSSVSNLLKAYRHSPPALRKLFAEGMESRAVVELQSVFKEFDQAGQVAFARQLHGLSKRQVLAIKDLIARSIPAEVALETVTGPQILKAASRNKKGRAVPKKETPTASQPDEGKFEAVADLTGASTLTVNSVFSRARKNQSGMETVILACAFIGRGGTPRNALKKAEVLAQNQKASKLVRRYLVLLNKAKKFIDQLDDDSQQEFLQTIFFGGLP
jgi:ParB/RepB/Spo0J family partition protein